LCTSRLTTDDEGIAKNVFWITDRRGRKLSHFHAEMLGERVADFVVYCTPDQKVRAALKGRQAHPQHSVHVSPFLLLPVEEFMGSWLLV
jgi:hypothetical protein